MLRSLVCVDVTLMMNAVTSVKCGITHDCNGNASVMSAERCISHRNLSVAGDKNVVV